LKILGQNVIWRDERLFQQALTHRSKGSQNNERLEFLGDSVLSLVISDCLYNQFEQLSEGELSRLRSQLVKGKTLAEVARHYRLGDLIKLGQGEIKSGGVNKSSVLADAVEAIFGAVYIDQGYQISYEFIRQVMQPWLQDIDPESIKKDAKSALQEQLQSIALPIPDYQLEDVVEQDNEPIFKVICRVEKLNLLTRAEARSRKKAEQIAADLMITLLRK